MDDRIAELVSQYKLIGYHHPDSRRAAPTGKGFPDWVIIGRRILYREVKGSNDILLPHQRYVGRAIMLAGGDWGVWQPGDFRAGGLVVRDLQEIARG
jgi:hypothetical protein